MKRVTRNSEWFLAKVTKKEDGCWHWNGAINPGGYGHFFQSFPTRRTNLAHRLSWELFRGPIPAGMLVLHKCDVRRCCNPEHLFLGTQFQNVHDCISKNRHGTQKIWEPEANEILRMKSIGNSIRSIGLKFNISISSVRRILSEDYQK